MDEQAVKAVLERKLQVYKASGQSAAADNVQHILDKGVMAVKATAHVSVFNPHEGSRKKMKLRETIPAVERRREDVEATRFGVGKGLAIAKRMADDPVYAAEIEHALRRPVNADRFRHGVAGRAAVKSPMLNADPQCIKNALAYNEPNPKDRVPKARVVEELIVKPRSGATAQGFWGERRWLVYSLKYTKGFVIVTDKDQESKVFQSMGELRKAAIDSGWELVR